MQWSVMMFVLLWFGSTGILAETKQQDDATQSDVVRSSDPIGEVVLTEDTFDQMSDKLAEPRKWPESVEKIIQKIKRPALATILWFYGVKCWCARQYHYLLGHSQEKDDSESR